METYTVGDVAGRLGVSASTVRMWGTRYGLSASTRSPGGHRRYTADDLHTLEAMHALVLTGVDPAQAAGQARGDTPASPAGAPAEDGDPPLAAPVSAAPRGRRGGPGGSVLPVPGGSTAARGLARAASRLDEMAVEDTIVESMRSVGALATWNDVVRPVLVAVGEQWQRTGGGIEVEHLLAQAVSTACVRYASRLPEPPRERPVLLSGGPREEHVLALHALQAALTERGVPARLLGPRTPMGALAVAARRTRSAGALVWLSLPDPAATRGVAEVRAAHRRMVVLVGGPGWTTTREQVEAAGGTVAGSPELAVDLLANAWNL